MRVVPARLRSETKQRFVSLAWRTLRAILGARAARRAARRHPALDAEAAYRMFLAGRDVRVPRPARAVPDGPLVSILMPVFDAPVRDLARALASVRAQGYGCFELCAADAGPASAPASALLRDAAAADPRIRWIRVGANRGIGGNTNAALDAAQGEYVTFLDQDDLFAPDALEQLVSAALAAPEADLVYSDKDNVTPWGDRYDPYFKPGWSPELLLCTNYVSHAALVRREALLDLGGLATDLDGAQDWDLFLRLAEKDPRVVHVPRVLYHWRSVRTSAASTREAKPYLPRAARAALARALERRALPGRVPAEGRVHVLPAFARSPSIAAAASPEEAAGARGDFVLFRDPAFRWDAEDGARTLAFWASLPGVGAAGAVVHDRRGRIEHTGLAFAEGRALPLFAGADPGRWSPLGFPGFVRNVSALGPGVWITRRDVLTAVGAAPSASEYSARVRGAGLRCVVVPDVVAFRIQGSLELPSRFDGVDPYFNPNLDPRSPVPRPRAD